MYRRLRSEQYRTSSKVNTDHTMAKPFRAAEKKSDEPYRILLLGGTGSGKSSLGNSLLGGRNFEEMASLSSVTTECKLASGYLDIDDKTVKIQVWDTPGLCDTHKEKAETVTEITKCLATISPGPHVILTVVKATERFTKEQHDIFQNIKELLGPDLVMHMIVVFTGGDKYTKQGTSLEKEISKSNNYTKSMLEDVNDRYILIDNDAVVSGNKALNQRQMRELLKLIEHVSPEHKIFTTEMLQELHKLVEAAVQAKMQSNKGSSYNDARELVVSDLINHGILPNNYMELVVVVKKRYDKFCKIF